MKQNWAPNVFTEHNIQSKNVLYPVPAAGTRPGGLPVPAAWTTYQFPSLPKSCNIISSALLVSQHRHLYAHLSCELYMKTLLFIVDRKLHVETLIYLFWCHSHYSSRHLELMFNVPVMHVC